MKAHIMFTNHSGARATGACTARKLGKPVSWVMLVWVVSACASDPGAPTSPGTGSISPANSSAAAAAGTPQKRGDAVNASRQAVTRALQLGCSQHAHCATIGIGARACGGPEQFLAYSVRDTPGPALQQANQQYSRQRRKQLEERGEMSTCELLPDPGAQCSPAGQCQLNPAEDGRRLGWPGNQAR